MCPFREAYGCTEVAREISRGELGYCAIERVLFNSAIAKGLWLLGRRGMEEATEEERVRVRLFAEACVYRHRAGVGLEMQTAGRTEVLDGSGAWRYLTAGMNAVNARQEDLLGDRTFPV